MSKQLFTKQRDKEINTLSRRDKGIYLKGLYDYEHRNAGNTKYDNGVH